MQARRLLLLTSALLVATPALAQTDPAAAQAEQAAEAQAIDTPEVAGAPDAAVAATAAGGTQPGAGRSAADVAAETRVSPQGAGATPAPEIAGEASADAELREAAASYFEPIPRMAELPSGAPMTREKIDLGAMLFFDPRMSLSGVFSCQSCHNVGMGGTDQLQTSIGHGWQQGPRNSPTMLNAIFNSAQFWDGRAADLAEQAKGPVQAGVEMNNTPENLIETLKSMPGYVDAFDAAFPGVEDPITFDSFAHAIEVFEATLITPNSRFDQWLLGSDGAMNEQEKRGLLAFMDYGCTACHSGVNLGGEGYYPFGLVEVPDSDVRPEDDRGRFMVTQTEGDEYVFRAAPLRNVALTPPYFHSGQVWDLEEAVHIMSTSQLGTELADAQAADITAFLGTLTGEQPQLVHPILPTRGGETPNPQPVSLQEQGTTAPEGADAAEAVDPGTPAAN